MPIPLRIQSENVLYHVVHRGNDRIEIFHDEEDYLMYESLIVKNKIRYDIQFYHYNLMPNHPHMLIEPTIPDSLSKFMKSVNASYTIYHQKRYGNSGHVWQPRFKAIPIETDTYYLRCARYIELNPVRAGLVQHPKDYRWSSYKHSVLCERKAWLDTHPLLKDFQRGGPGQTAYEAFVNEDAENARRHRGERFEAAPAYGSPEFISRFAKQLRITHVPNLIRI